MGRGGMVSALQTPSSLKSAGVSGLEGTVAVDKGL